MTTFEIEIISDVVCPWCFIGSRRLQKAIDMYRNTYPDGSKDTFNIRWKPYFLDENPPATPVSSKEHAIARMGPKRAASVTQYLERIGSVEGIRFGSGGGGVVGGTAPCHALLHLAGTIGVEQQNKVMQELFHAYFEEEKDIFNVPALVEIGIASGMERGFLEKGFEEGKVLEEVKKEAREIKSTGITGVPRYSIGGVKLEGARDPGEFFEALLRVKEGKVE